MSDDLISREEVIDILENMMFEAGKDLSKSYLLQDARERIIGLNTAFDKEKVIESIRVVTAGYVLNYIYPSGYVQGCVDMSKEIIKIIEKGGIE